MGPGSLTRPRYRVTPINRYVRRTDVQWSGARRASYLPCQRQDASTGNENDVQIRRSGSPVPEPLQLARPASGITDDRRPQRSPDHWPVDIIGLPGHGVVEGKVFRDRLPQGEAAPAHMLRVPAFHAPSQGVERDPKADRLEPARPATRLVAIERREGVNTSVLLRIPGSEVAARSAAPPLLLRGNAMTILSASFLNAQSSESELLQKVLHPAGSSRGARPDPAR